MDHEASGAQEWQLPGYGRGTSTTLGSSSKQTTTQTPASASKSPINSQKPAAGQSQRHVLSPTPGAKGSTPNGRGSGRGGFRGRGRGSYNTGRGNSSAAAPRSSTHLFKDSPAKAKWRADQEANGFIRLPTSWGSMKYEFLAVAKSKLITRKTAAPTGRYEVFEDIAQKTGAFVNPPSSYTQQALYIWGDPTQVASAKDILHKLVGQCNSASSTKKNKIEWAKIYAHSNMKEADMDLKERRETILQQLRKVPDLPSAFPEQLLFLWPKDGPPLNESLGSHLEALDVIRAKFGCHLFIPKELPDCICALGQNYDVMQQIAHRLRTKWSEIIVSSNVKSKVLVVEPPGPSSMGGQIVVKNNNQFARAFLHGASKKGLDLEQWADRAALIRSKNNDRILSAIEKSLRGVAFVRGHLRMRVNIGSFVLDKYRRPKDDKPSYAFEEFREMLMHEQTKGRLVPGLRTNQDELLASCFQATALLESNESATRALERAEPAFSVNFEFLGSNNDLLRLEAEFARCPGAQEYEVTQRRWLRPRSGGQTIDKRSPLQIAVVDFERSDWQLEIKSLDFQEASLIDSALRSFSHSINFRRTENMNDISAAPQRKVIFPATAPVSRFVEKTAIRYRLMGTKYTFEIARYDEYSRTLVPAFPGQNPLTMVGSISEKPSTSWGASVFDPNWDNLLGQHANLPVGHSARYSPNLDTFFPPYFAPQEQSSSGEKHTGFWNFVSLVQQAAELLSPARPLSPPAPKAGTSKTSSNPKKPASPGGKKGKTTSNSSSPTIDAKGLTGMIDADLGTLF